MSKGKNEISRIHVKDGFDPLVQIRPNEKEQSNIKKSMFNSSQIINPNEKNYIEEKLFDNPLNNEISHVFDLDTQISESMERRSNTTNLKFIKNDMNQTKKIEETFNKINYNDNKSSSQKNKIISDELSKYCDLLKAESIDHIICGTFTYQEFKKEGIIFLTEYRLFMLSEEDKEYFFFHLLAINKVEKSNDKKNVDKNFLEITLKDGRIFSLNIWKDDQQKLYQNLLKYEYPKDYSNFAKKYRVYNPVNFDGWNIYNYRKEFERLGLLFDQNNKDENKKLRLVKNNDFSICDTYPEFLILPINFDDESLNESRNFRTKNRVPVLTWIHKKTGVTLWRSSQTKGGLTGHRCQHDEKLLTLIGKLGKDKLVIFDARPKINALANRFKGGGYENTQNYNNTEFHFCEIDNIHCVRNALFKIHTLCKEFRNENKKFLNLIEQSLWLDFIHLLLKSASDIAITLTKENSVLIHCSDGWDRSTQLITLTQIMLDPYYRTIRGFIVLIEKDWLSFGHQFAMRNGCVKDANEDQRAPIFLQWLDCVHQLQNQFRYAFEFNNEFLQFLAYHSNSWLYGTFLYNTERERIKDNAKTHTVSVWTDLLENLDIYKNKYYLETCEKTLFPNYSLYKLRFWEEYFLKNNPSYLKSLNKTIFAEYNNCSLTSCFYEKNKKDDLHIIESQQKKLEIYENTIKDFIKFATTNNFINDLTNESKFIVSKIFKEEHELKIEMKIENI